MCRKGWIEDERGRKGGEGVRDRVMNNLIVTGDRVRCAVQRFLDPTVECMNGIA